MATVLGLAMAAVSLALVVVTISLARSPTRLSGWSTAIRLGLKVAAILVIASISGISAEPEWGTGAFVLGVGFGFYQGSRMEIWEEGGDRIAQRTAAGALVFGGAVVALQVLAALQRVNAIDLGQTLGWFGVAITAGIVLERSSRRSAPAGPATATAVTLVGGGVAAWLAMSGSASAALWLSTGCCGDGLSDGDVMLTGLVGVAFLLLLAFSELLDVERLLRRRDPSVEERRALGESLTRHFLFENRTLSAGSVAEIEAAASGAAAEPTDTTQPGPPPQRPVAEGTSAAAEADEPTPADQIAEVAHPASVDAAADRSEGAFEVASEDAATPEPDPDRAAGGRERPQPPSPRGPVLSGTIGELLDAMLEPLPSDWPPDLSTLERLFDEAHRRLRDGDDEPEIVDDPRWDHAVAAMRSANRSDVADPVAARLIALRAEFGGDGTFEA